MSGLRWWLIAALMCSASAASAQEPCAASAQERLDGAWRARRVMDERRVAQAKLDEALGQVQLAQERAGDAPGPLLALSFGGELGHWGGVETCERGARRDATWTSTRGSVLLALRLDDAVRVDGFMVQAIDALAVEGQRARRRVQGTYGARLQLGEWASVFAAWVTDTQRAEGAEEARIYLALGVPVVGLSLELMADPKLESPQTVYLDVRELMGPGGLSWSGRVGYLEDEGQLFTTVGVSVPLVGKPTRQINLVDGSFEDKSGERVPADVWRIVWWIMPELSAEWTSPGLRHGRLRLGVDADTATRVDGEGHVGAGTTRLWVDVTRFSSAAFTQQTGSRRAWGGSAGASIVGATRDTRGGGGSAASLDLLVALNRPELLSMASALAFAGVELRVGATYTLYF